jgi:putative hemolysin
MTLLLVGIAISLVLSAFFSGSESGFYFIKKEKLSVLEAQGNGPAKRLLKLLKSPGALVSTMLIGNNIALQLGTEVTFLYLNKEWENPWLSLEVATTLILFLPFFIFGEVLPKATYRLHAEFLLLRSVVLIIFCRWIFSPIATVVSGITWILERSFGIQREESQSFDRENLSANLGHAYAGGVLSEEQLDSVSQAMNTGDLPVERRMTPLLQGTMVSAEATLKEISDLYRKNASPCFPVYGRKRTEILGVVDLRRLAHKKGSLDLSKNLLPMTTVEWGTPFHQTLDLFFDKNSPIIFVQRQGKTVGYITWVDALTKLLS